MEKDIKNILIQIGEDITREGIIETPKRVAKAYSEIFSGYKEDARHFVKLFESDCAEMVCLNDIEFYSMCEHHLFPFFGKISIGYVPQGKVIGVSKLARIVAHFSKKLQIQERLTDEIADFLYKELNAAGVIVFCSAEHLCMKMRGIKCQNSAMTTTALRGIFKNNPELKKDFFTQMKSNGNKC